MNRNSRAKIGKETLEILDRGFFDSSTGQRIDMNEDIKYAVENTVVYKPEQLATLVTKGKGKLQVPTVIEVTEESSIAASCRLVNEGNSDVLCLNFASAKHAGGGFLSGARAQEESLARSSALYTCLKQSGQAYYSANSHFKPSGLYTDHLIYSPSVPVFRDDNYELLERTYKINFITSPAVNAGVLRKQHHLGSADAVEQLLASTMIRRINFLLAVAEEHKHNTLVLGAWGCGAFRNTADQVARWFGQCLLEEGNGFNRVFPRIIFAILDESTQQTNLQAFKKQFDN